MSGADSALLAVAGVVAGVVGTAGGITSLVSYPVLLAVGLPPVAANVANIVALVACWPASALGSRPELAGRGRWLARWMVVAAAGGAAGAGLLRTTPSGAFRLVVPALVLVGSGALLLGPRLAQVAAARPGAGRRALGAGLGAVSVYNGYFGAGAGVMVLALVLATVDPSLPRANAVKNMAIGAATAASAVVLALAGPVRWVAVAPLGAGMLLGGTLGPAVARHVPAALLRWVVALIGVGLAVDLWLRPG